LSLLSEKEEARNLWIGGKIVQHKRRGMLSCWREGRGGLIKDLRYNYQKKVGGRHSNKEMKKSNRKANSLGCCYHTKEGNGKRKIPAQREKVYSA